MNAIDLAFSPAIDQAAAICRKEISPLELVDLYLGRIDRLNPKLGSFFYVMADQAREEAQQKTEQLAALGTASTDWPPFFGVPTAIKDLHGVAGVPCSYGLAVARDRKADRDEGVVQRIRQAGFIILGKTATSQMGSLPYTEPPGFPPARNPWNLDYTPGGSSGGSAAAVAAGLCALAQASDGGGSVRGPASLCGLVGIKPSRGRISNAPLGDRMGGLATNGPIGRTVVDTAAFLDVMAGYITGDPYWLPSPQPSFQVAARQMPDRLRIGFSLDFQPSLTSTHPLCQDVVRGTATLLENLGHQVEPVVWPDLSRLVEPFVILWQCVTAEANVPGFVLEKFNRWLLGRAKRIDSGAYLRALDQVQMIARETVTFCEPYDLMLLPVYSHPAIPIGHWQNLRPAQILDRVIAWVLPCAPFNASGQPAIVVPRQFDAQGVPIGIQLIGRPGGEATLISLAAQLETAQPWAHHRPPC